MMKYYNNILRNKEYISPLGAMVAIWRQIIVSFRVFVTERVHLNLDLVGEMHK
jgi:hypothetical protein